MTLDVPTGGLSSLLGFEFAELTGERAVLTWEVVPDQHQTFGIVHGGVYCAAVETVASMGAAAWFGNRGKVVGVANQTDFVRAISEGRLTATGTPLHQGRSQQLWTVEITDENDRLIARGQVRLQNLADRE